MILSDRNPDKVTSKLTKSELTKSEWTISDLTFPEFEVRQAVTPMFDVQYEYIDPDGHINVTEFEFEDVNIAVGQLMVYTECMRTHVVRARADVVDTKLGIIGANVVRAHERFPCGGRRSGH